MSKIKSALIKIGSVIAAIAAAIFGFLLLKGKKSDDIDVVSINDAFKVEDNLNGTQKLPDTPDLDNTLDNIEKDILN